MKKIEIPGKLYINKNNRGEKLKNIKYKKHKSKMQNRVSKKYLNYKVNNDKIKRIKNVKN